MVRYPHTGTLVSPGSSTWIKGKAVASADVEEAVECEVQTDSSNFTVTLNGKSVVAKYRVFLPNRYQTATSARTFRFNGKSYDILQAFPNQHQTTMKIG